jgi:uncharacterized membrane protein YadS
MRSWLKSEDSWAVVTGLLVVALGLLPLAGVNALGWVPKAQEWAFTQTLPDGQPTDIPPPAAVVPATEGYPVPGWAGVLLLYVALLGFLCLGVWRMGHSVKRFAIGFSVMFAVGYGCWVLGHFGYIAATPNKLASVPSDLIPKPGKSPKLGIPWCLGLTGEFGYLLALAAGLLVGNLFPKVGEWLRESARTEWYIKTAIVIVGGVYGFKAAEYSGQAATILFRGLAAIIEAYLIYWAVVYFLARKVFGFSREWAAPLASGISICGVSAAITTGAAVRARPVVPVMVSSLVVLFSVVELVVLPIAARMFLKDEPMVAAAWMGLAVKTDGAAFSSGAITEGMMSSDAQAAGVTYEKGWMEMTTGTVKVFIDLFIGVWAVVLAVVWAYGIDRKPGQGVPLKDIWGRFPKFVFGYVLAFAVLLTLGLQLYPPLQRAKATIDAAKAAKEPITAEMKDTLKTAEAGVKPVKDGMEQADQLRRVFFVLTFFAIGMGANLRRLWAEGLGKLALVYAVSLFGFVIWFGLLVSWLFFHGMKPPEVKTTQPTAAVEGK